MKDLAWVFQEWYFVMDQMLVGIENWWFCFFDDFLEFFSQFFECCVLCYFDFGGIFWYVYMDDFIFKYEEEQFVVIFEGFDFMVQWCIDFIFIYQIFGIFELVECMWWGIGGWVIWEWYGLFKGVFVELGDYEFEVIKSLYIVEDVKMYYLVYFGNKVVMGIFSDKFVLSSDVVEGLFLRFEFIECLEVSNIGEGIVFEGYFCLYGIIVYGFGNK